MEFWKSSRWYIAGAVTALAIGGGVVVSAGSGDPTVAVHITPERVVDTREAGSALTTFGASEEQFLDFTAFVPAGARAVTVNITVVDGSSNSHLIVWPSGEVRPSTSVINWEGGNTFAVANAMDVELGDDLKLGIFNHAGTVEVIVDLMGYHIDAPAGPAAQTLIFQQKDPGFFGENGVPVGTAAAIGTLTFDSPVAGTALITGSSSVQSPGGATAGIQGKAWIVSGTECTYDADLATEQGLGTTVISAASISPTTVSISYSAPVVAGSNTVSLCASVVSSTATDVADQRGVFRFRNVAAVVATN